MVYGLMTGTMVLLNRISLTLRLKKSEDILPQITNGKYFTIYYQI